MTGDQTYEFLAGDLPLLVSIPHDGREIPGSIAARMTPPALELPDTDWHVARLYAFCRNLGASMLVARCSRYVVDLNRPPDDASLYPGQLSTGLCPTQTFAGDPVYRRGKEPDAGEIRERVASYWRPYHARIAGCLETMLETHGYALLWDAHSITSVLPLLFTGRLPMLNIGTNDGKSCAPEIQDAVLGVAAGSSFSHVVNGRFRGGYITRRYGNPGRGVHAVQLELAQCAYMDEETGHYDDVSAAQLVVTLRRMLEACVDAGNSMCPARYA